MATTERTLEARRQVLDALDYLDERNPQAGVVILGFWHARRSEPDLTSR